MDLMHRDNLSGAESKELIAKAMKKISDWKNDLILPEQAHSTCETPEDVQFAHLYQLYERNLRAYNAVDFDDLIVMPTRLLQENAEVRDKWQNRVRYLLVDEYQDTNTAQYILVKLLVGVMGRLLPLVMMTSRFMHGEGRSLKTWLCLNRIFQIYILLSLSKITVRPAVF